MCYPAPLFLAMNSEDGMSEKAAAALEIYKAIEGQEEGVGEWIEVDQDRINTFADATLDHQFIHIDPEKAAELSPYKVTIAHGFLTLSLIVHLGGSIPPLRPEVLDGVFMGVNYGLDKVRFPAPVPVNSKVRARHKLLSAELKGDNTIQVKRLVTVEIEGGEKPVCVAESLIRYMYAD
jgi:acyl dehydratase